VMPQLASVFHFRSSPPDNHLDVGNERSART
jgi:hypothetical protein